MNSRSGGRLQGFILKRLQNSSKSWIKVCPHEFCAAVGLSRRQFFYAKRSLELHKGRLVQFKTVLKQSGRGWVILASRISLPNGLEVFSVTSTGRGRRARLNMRRTRVTAATECNPIRGLPTVSRTTKPRVRVLEPSAGQIRLAHHLKRVLEGYHWDNCKVIYHPGCAFNYARDMLAAGVSYGIILDSYESGLSAMHASATDYGLFVGNPRFKYVASSTVRRARASCWASFH